MPRPTPPIQRTRKLNWRTCDGAPCPLNDLNLDSVPDAQGVYIIWREGTPSLVVYAGKVDSPSRTLADRFREHIRDDDIQFWQEDGVGELCVTCAVVRDLGEIPGIERFLIDELQPFENDVTPSAPPIRVNLPAFLPARH